MDVLVLGGGAAGLRAAIVLGRAGRRVRLLEGRDRLGGRIHTLHEPGWPPFEAGAEFVHGRPPVTTRLARELGLRLREHDPQHLLFDGRLRRADRMFAQAMALMDRLPREAPDRSYARVAGARWWRALAAPPVQALARAFVEGFNAADAAAIGVLGLAQQTDAAAEIEGDRMLRVQGGYGRVVDGLLAQALAGGVDVRTGAEITDVRWRPGQVEVRARTPAGARLPAMIARAAVIALPLGVLQARPPARAAVRFHPALPEDKREAIARLGFGPVVRLALRFGHDVPGVGRKDFGFLHVVNAPFPTFWKLPPQPQARAAPAVTVIAWSAGPAAVRLNRAATRKRTAEDGHGAADDHRLQIALATLARGLELPNATLRAGLQGWRLFDWHQDPFARGAYSFSPPGGAYLPNQLATPVADTLFFAGEATHTRGATGTVHGALESGDHAAALLQTALSPPRRR